MELYLIRHGQSTNNAGLPHVADPPLSDLGKQQACYAGESPAKGRNQPTLLQPDAQSFADR